MKDKDWRTANAPKWAIEAAEAEIERLKLAAALSWPREPKPDPVSFSWGDYDHIQGDPQPGIYWTNLFGTRAIEIALTDKSVINSYKKWMFREVGKDWTAYVTRGPLYRSERDARLAKLWEECEDAANRLKTFKDEL